MEYNTKDRQDTVANALAEELKLNVVYNDKVKCFEIYTNSPIELINIKRVLKID